MSRRIVTPGGQLPGRLAVAFGLLLAVALGGCRQSAEPVFQGYVEGDFVLVAAPLGGQLKQLEVQRGDRVAQGAPLFVLDRVAEQAEVAAARQQLKRAENQLADLQKGLRPTELAEIRSQLQQAEAALALAAKELKRRQALLANRIIPQEDLDRARSTWQQDQAAVARLKARLETGSLGARSDVVAAARAERGAARARLTQATWALDQKRQSAPRAGLVFDTLYVAGEYVGPGAPVVSLLPPGNVKIRFFVPEPVVGTLQPGQQVQVSFDGEKGSLPARISYISPQAEYTPPVIYSRSTRSKLVYLVEARPEPAAAKRLHPGQPVEVRLGGGHD